MTARTGLFIVLLVTLLTIDVSATPVTDTWERTHFTQATSPYTTSDHLTMSLTLDVDVSLCPIPPCSAIALLGVTDPVDVAIPYFAKILDYRFSDGHQVLTPANSTLIRAEVWRKLSEPGGTRVLDKWMFAARGLSGFIGEIFVPDYSAMLAVSGGGEGVVFAGDAAILDLLRADDAAWALPEAPTVHLVLIGGAVVLAALFTRRKVSACS